MDLGLKDRLTLLTGASRGIGAGIAQSLAAEGARLVLVARSREGLEAVRSRLANPEVHHVVPVDLQVEAEPERLAETISGLGPLDIAVHNLGGSLGITDPFASSADWQKVWQFNVGIALTLNRRLIPGMISRKWGRIVHLSTLSTTTFKGNAPYVAAKCALDAYVKSIAREVGKHGVIVSAVAPGAIRVEGRHLARLQRENPEALAAYFKSDLPIGRLGEPSDVAAVVSFLCSEHASFMAGSIVAVDGGGM